MIYCDILLLITILIFTTLQIKEGETMRVAEKTYMSKILLNFLIVVIGIFMSTQLVHAQTATLKLDDGSNSVTILDNSVADRDNRLGVVDWSGSVGVFNLSIVTGTTKPCHTLSMPMNYTLRRKRLSAPLKGFTPILI